MESESKRNLFKFNSTFSRPVIVPSLIVIVSITFLCSFFPFATQTVLNGIKGFIFEKLSWLYVMLVTCFVFFLFFIALSKYGKIRLGRDDSKPEYSFATWLSMLFAAGMGIGLMYFGVSEPLSHYSNDLTEGLTGVEKAKEAQLYTFFHWGIHAWSIYAVVGLILAYFTYRYNLPLALRSALYPMLKDRIKGRYGDVIDIFALCSTFFGIATTLGFGVVQLNAGLSHLGILPGNSFGSQTLIVLVVMFISILSALSGVNKGVKILSEINIVTAILLMLFVLLAGPTVYLMNSFSEGIGNYMNRFLGLTFNTFAYEKSKQEWFTGWTILYWAWWISWAPYVGLFIAKISKGRTIRQFIIAVLLLPSLFNFMWMTIFGNSAIWIDENTANGALSSVVGMRDTLLFSFLDQLPLGFITSLFAVIIICIFFITSADSGIYVMNNIATQNAEKSPKWQTIFFGILLVSLSLSLLKMGGLESLQTMTLITALPFAFIMLLLSYNLLKALYIDDKYHSTEFSPATSTWTGKHWKERLDLIVTFSEKKDVNKFINTLVKQAFIDLIEELNSKGIKAEMQLEKEPQHYILIEIEHENMKSFQYGVKAEKQIISDVLVNEENMPGIQEEEVFIPKTFFEDGRAGYDIHYFTKEEVISDVLKHYERFLSFASEESNELFMK